LKTVELRARDSVSLGAEYQNQISTIDPTEIFDDYKRRLQEGITNSDLPTILRLYDNKGLLARASSLLGLKSRNELLDKVRRHLGNGVKSKLSDELTRVLPAI
jgi:hypothetical protein